MTTGERETGNSPEDEVLSRLYQQITEMQTARLGAGYDMAAGLDRFLAWLREHIADDKTGLAPVRAADRGAAGPCRWEQRDRQPPAGRAETADRASRGPEASSGDPEPGLTWTLIAR